MGTDRRTDTKKLIVDFLNFAKAPKESHARTHAHTHTHAHTRKMFNKYVYLGNKN